MASAWSAGPDSQVVQTLREGWVLAPDPENAGRQQGWWEKVRAEARPAPVPGVVHQVWPEHTGVAWYWCSFRPLREAAPTERYLLRFGAVMYLAEVWVNGVSVGGHEGGETPFVLDATGAVRPDSDNLLAVRVLVPTPEGIDGYRLAQVPSSNQRNYGGMVLPVELLVVPQVRIADLYARPHLEDGRIRLEVAVANHGETAVRGNIAAAVGPDKTGEVLEQAGLEAEFPPGESRHLLELRVAQPRVWDLDDPHLYRVQVLVRSRGDDGKPLTHASAVRCGFRDFRVKDGFFHLNGRRIFLRSSHTGNHYPMGHIVPPDPNFLRRDLLYAKVSGFNMVRFIASVPFPEQLDFCDEIGLMVYEESAAGWGLQDSPRMAERFSRAVSEVVKRDRSHPSLTVYGLLNETPDGPVFRCAVGLLPLIRSLDDSRLVLLSSGRHDAQAAIGSLSNPGSATWEYQWGGEAPGAVSAGVEQGMDSGYAQGMGDVHFYLSSPHPPERVALVRRLGHGTRPVFLSEYGVGSLMDVADEARRFEQAGADPRFPDTAVLLGALEKLERDWQRLGMEETYPFVRDMLRESQRLHGRKRLVGFDLIRANPRICGYNLTGLLDHGITGEGLWTFWREWKPGLVDALRDGWARLRWCLFLDPMHGYLGRPMGLEAVLATEDALRPGEYPVRFRVLGPEGLAWEQEAGVRIPRDRDLAVPVLETEFRVEGPAGEYLLAAEMEQGGCPAGGRLRFYQSDAAHLPRVQERVLLWGIEEPVRAWLERRGVDCRPFPGTRTEGREVILVGTPPQTGPMAWRELARRMAQGSAVVFLSPPALCRGQDPVGWLPLARKGRCYLTPDFNYIKECVARPHPLFRDLHGRGIMDWDYYGPLMSRYMFEGQDTPDEVVVAGFIVGHANYADRYACGTVMGGYRFGAGSFFLNTLKLLEKVDRHPAADRLLLGLIAQAADRARGPAAPLPGDFEETLRQIGFAREV